MCLAICTSLSVLTSTQTLLPKLLCSQLSMSSCRRRSFALSTRRFLSLSRAYLSVCFTPMDPIALCTHLFAMPAWISEEKRCFCTRRKLICLPIQLYGSIFAWLIARFSILEHCLILLVSSELKLKQCQSPSKNCALTKNPYYARVEFCLSIGLPDTLSSLLYILSQAQCFH